MKKLGDEERLSTGNALRDGDGTLALPRKKIEFLEKWIYYIFGTSQSVAFNH